MLLKYTKQIDDLMERITVRPPAGMDDKDTNTTDVDKDPTPESGRKSDPDLNTPSDVPAK